MKALKTIASIGIMLLGVGLFLYPIATEAISEAQTMFYVKQFEKERSLVSTTGSGSNITDNATISESATAESDSASAITNKESDPIYQKILEYNNEIYENGQSGFQDAWDYQQTPIDIGTETFGYIEIPSIKVELPLYVGASDSHMAKGAAILNQTSIPVGGTNTNSVIVGHRGWKTGAFLKKIEGISIGDYIYITNLWEKLRYRVTGIDIIMPTDIEKIMIQEGKDMVTLVTCHPYGSHGNKYRYVVYCERDESSEGTYDATTDSSLSSGAAQDSPSDTLVGSDGTTYELSTPEIEQETWMQYIGSAIIIVLLLKSLVNKIKKRKT